MKRPLRKVYEPDEGITHVAADPLADAVTLCGKTDWIGSTKPQEGEEIGKPVDCQSCRSIFDYCNAGKWPT